MHAGIDGQRTAVSTVSSRPKVTIVSDVLLYRDGLDVSLSRDGRVSVLDRVSAVDALPSLARNMPDAVLLDGALHDGLVLARQIRAMFPGLKMIGFAISGGSERMVECAECGLSAFVDSGGNVESLIEAVLAALRGEFACPPKVSALICERLANVATGLGKPTALTRREREIASLIGHGLSNKEIARDLNIGPSTVKNHVHSILEKLNVRRRSAIVSQLGAMPWIREFQD